MTLRLPVALLDPDTAATYCVGESAHSWATRAHVILDLHSEDDEGDDWCDGEGRLASIVPARSELAAGDLRLLYLAWLLCVQARELEDDEVEPPVPPGLGELSGPLRALADFLRLDPDLLAAASESSAALKARAPSGPALTRWVKALSEAEKNAILLRLLKGDDAHLRSELLRRFHGPSAGRAVTGSRTVGDLLAAAEARWAERQRLAEQRKAAERARREQAAAAAREQRLEALAGQQEEAWLRVAAMIETKKPKEYDAAIELLRDLQALGQRDGSTAAFNRRMRLLRQQHARKPSLLERLDHARLG